MGPNGRDGALTTFKMTKKRNIVLILAFLVVGTLSGVADNEVRMSQKDGTDFESLDVTAVTNGVLGFDGSDNLVGKTSSGLQTPWTQDIDADGFDLRDLSNLEFRVTTGAPAGTVPGLSFDAGGINLNVPTADLFDFLVNNVSQMTIDVSTVDFQGNTLNDILDITSITSLNGVAIADYILATDNLGALSATTSAQFAGVISDETGTGLVPLATNPTFTGLTVVGTMDLSSLPGTFTVTLNSVVNALDFDSGTLSIDGINNRVGVGTTTPAFLLSTHLSTASTSALNSSFRIETESTGDMVDGFGGGMIFAIEDTTSGIQNIALVAGQRDGADNNGALTFSTWNAGTRSEVGRFDTNGQFGIGLTDPQDKFEVAGGAILASAPTLNGATNNERIKIFMADGGSGTIKLEAEGSGVLGSLQLEAGTFVHFKASSGTQWRMTGANNVFGPTSNNAGFLGNTTARVKTGFFSTSVDVKALAGSNALLKLDTAELTIVTGDKLGQIDFAAPDETTGGDANLVAASFLAEAGSNFSPTNNDTDFVWALGLSETAAEKMRLDSSGNLALSEGAISGTDDATTLGAAATTFAITSNFASITGDAGGNTIATITGGVVGQTLILLFVGANAVTITDDNTHAADSLDLSAAFTSAPDTTISFIQNGTSWYETSRSAN